MKKLIMYFALALTVLAMPGMAQAETIHGWTLDLSGVTVAGYDDLDSTDVWNDLSILSISGSGTIYQQITGGGPLPEAGNTFLAESLVYTVGTTNSANHYTPFNLSNGLQLALYSDDLMGYVESVDPVESTFTYLYTSGTVTLGLYDSATETMVKDLAALTLDWGFGEAATNDEGGLIDQGDTAMSIQFITAALFEGLISFNPADYPGLADAYPWLSTYWVIDFDNGILGNTITPNGDGTATLTAQIDTKGRISLVATPEPSTFLILGFGLLGLVGFRKKFKKA
jgi:hypothetical protein